MHDWSLIALEVTWKTAELRIGVKGPAGAGEIRASGLRKLDLARDFAWGPSVSINSVIGPQALPDGGFRLILEMQSGDRIAAEADSFLPLPGPGSAGHSFKSV